MIRPGPPPTGGPPRVAPGEVIPARPPLPTALPRSTRSYAILDVSPGAWREIARALDAAGYAHAFVAQGDGELIDMHGLALRRAP